MALALTMLPIDLRDQTLSFITASLMNYIHVRIALMRAGSNVNVLQPTDEGTRVVQDPWLN